MTDRISINDPTVRDRMERAMSQLLSFYPDKAVVRLDSEHKKLGERLTRLWRDAGYDSRTELLQAYGFEVAGRSDGVGRPLAFDPEELLAELQRRYEGKPKPKKLGLLILENSDLKGNLKTLGNKANEVFGRTLAKELAARGIIDRGPAVPDISDDEIKALVDGLIAYYVAVSDKPKTLGELKERHPDKADIIDALQKYGVSSELFGATASDYLKKNGVLEAGARYVDASAVEAALSEIEAASAGLENDGKPKTIAGLALQHPDYAQLIKDGQIRGLIAKRDLQRRGILGFSEASLRRSQKQLVARSIRNASLGELIRAYRECGGQDLVVPSDGVAPYLRPGVIGIDVGTGHELRETVLNVVSPDRDVRPDTKVTVTISLEADVNVQGEMPTLPGKAVAWATERFNSSCWVFVDAEGMGRIARIGRDGVDSFLVCGSGGVGSSLSEFAGAEVASVSSLRGVTVLQIRHCFLAPLSTGTLIYALRELGAIDDQDLLGGDAWRERLLAEMPLPDEAVTVAPSEQQEARGGLRGDAFGAGEFTLRPGDAVVHTGFSYEDELKFKIQATLHGLRVTGAVSGKTRLLVARDLRTATKKARRALELGIRLVDYPTYVDMLNAMSR